MMGMLVEEPRPRFDYDSLDCAVAEESASRAKRVRELIRDKVMAGIAEISVELLTMKAKLEPGQFGRWLEVECSMSGRNARRYMSAVQLFERHSDTVSALPAAEIEKLAAPSIPPDLREAVIKEVESGAIPRDQRDVIEGRIWVLENEHERDRKQRRRQELAAKARRKRAAGNKPGRLERRAEKERREQQQEAQAKHEHAERETRDADLARRIAAAVTDPAVRADWLANLQDRAV